MQMKKGRIYDFERQKNIFSALMFIVFFVLAWVTSWLVTYSSHYHHSLLFNPWGDQFADNQVATWICVALHGLVCFILFLSKLCTIGSDKFMKSETYKAAFTFSRKEGVFSNLLQAAVPESAVDDEFEGYEYYDEGEEDGEDNQTGPPSQVRRKNLFSLAQRRRRYVLACSCEYFGGYRRRGMRIDAPRILVASV
jgi:hypothetical protein